MMMGFIATGNEPGRLPLVHWLKRCPKCFRDEAFMTSATLTFDARGQQSGGRVECLASLQPLSTPIYGGSMQKVVMSVALAAVLSAPVLAQNLESDAGKLGYSIGYEFGAELNSYDIDIDLESVFQAIRDAHGEREPRLEIAEMRQLMMALQEKIRQERMEAFQRLAEENQAKADTFLADNRGKSGIVTLPSGVQYRVIEEGEGARPGLNDTVTVHYRGSKIDGREFDSSFRRGIPAVFQVNSVIEGWQEVLPLMREGAMWQVFLPPELAFGVRGDPPMIGPSEALQFDIRLVQIGEPENFEGGAPVPGG
jgi:FKBP-type peptidyl-prolyl cis-trans isomerase FklB